MKRSTILFGGALLAAGLLAGGPAAATGGGERLFAGGLKGANEVPPASNGDPDGAGYAVVHVDTRDRKVCVEDFAVGGIATPTLFHIHNAPAGANGPVVVDFTVLLPSGTGCVDVANKELLKNIKQHPAEYYFNVHTAEFPGGAVRGQLLTIKT